MGGQYTRTDVQRRRHKQREFHSWIVDPMAKVVARRAIRDLIRKGELGIARRERCITSKSTIDRNDFVAVEGVGESYIARMRREGEQESVRLAVAGIERTNVGVRSNVPEETV